MRDFAENFYKGSQWQACRNEFIKSHPLCEKCLEKGIYNIAVIAHHKTPLSPENINDVNISLNWSNLQALCRDCHGEVHRPTKRYKLDELGRVIIKA